MEYFLGILFGIAIAAGVGALGGLVGARLRPR